MKPNQQPNQNPLLEACLRNQTPTIARPIALRPHQVSHLASLMPPFPVVQSDGQNQRTNHPFIAFCSIQRPPNVYEPILQLDNKVDIILIDDVLRTTLFREDLPPGVDLQSFISMLNMILGVLKGITSNGPLLLPNEINLGFNPATLLSILETPELSFFFDGRLSNPQVCFKLCDALLRACLMPNTSISEKVLDGPLGAMQAIRDMIPSQDENRPAVRAPITERRIRRRRGLGGSRRAHGGSVAVATTPAMNNGSAINRKRPVEDRPVDPEYQRARDECWESLKRTMENDPGLVECVKFFWGLQVPLKKQRRY